MCPNYLKCFTAHPKVSGHVNQRWGLGTCILMYVKSPIDVREGERNSLILVAEGQKQSAILEAEAAKAAQILKAEAAKQAEILKAEGEAEAILKIQQATAEGIRMINEASPGDGVIAIKSLEALEKVADGQATKIIIPSEIQSLAGLVTSASELGKGDHK